MTRMARITNPTNLSSCSLSVISVVKRIGHREQIDWNPEGYRGLKTVD